jgi:hypothetical protein
MNECDYCNVEAYVEDGKPCPQYTTTYNPERFITMLENAQIVATEICEKAPNCTDDSCICNHNDKECFMTLLYLTIEYIKSKLKKKSDYRKDAKDDI